MANEIVVGSADLPVKMAREEKENDAETAASAVSMETDGGKESDYVSTVIPDWFSEISPMCVGNSSTTTSKFSAFQPRSAKLSCLSMSSLHRNPFRVSIGIKKEFVVMKGKRRGSSAMCYTYAAPLCINTFQFISIISSTVLLLAKGTAVQKSFLVPLFLLQAPAAVILWIKGEYDACKHRWVDDLQRSGYGAHE
ncbi:hypothetical protein ACFX15_023410 [Malus domestica]